MDDDAVGFQQAEELLLGAEFMDCRELWYSSNYVYFAQLCGSEGQQFAAIYKPERGESPLWDFPSGQLYRREAAAYQLARLLEWPIVPPTVIRDGPHGIGSVQVFIKHDQEAHYFFQREQPAYKSQLKRMALFDFIANNADRKGGHCLLDGDGRIWGIDHGLCFHEEYKLRTVIWDWAGERISRAELRDVERVHDLLLADAEDAQPLIDLLSPREVAAMLQRMTKVQRSGALPLPGPHRSYPWPLV